MNRPPFRYIIKVVHMKFAIWASETIQDIARILEASIKICSLQMIDPEGKIWGLAFKLSLWLFHKECKCDICIERRRQCSTKQNK